jgi:hypothetical protein
LRALAAAALCLGSACLHAATACPNPPETPKAFGHISAWYDAYVKPFLVLGGIPESHTLTPEAIEGLIRRQNAYNQVSLRDSLYFEPLVRSMTRHYAKASDFSGLDRETAAKIHRAEAGETLDFSLLCIDTRTTAARDEAFAITLFAVNEAECNRIGLRGLVFTDTLVNGVAGGRCRPDHVYYRMLFLKIEAGTNTVTLVCRKESNACVRQ